MPAPKIFDMKAGLSLPARKATLLAKVAGIEHEVVLVALAKGEHKDVYDKDLPTNKVPALHDNGFVLFESNAIVRYLAAKYAPDFYSADLEKRAKIDVALEYFRSTLEEPIGKLGFWVWFAPMIEQAVPEGTIEPILEDIHNQLALIEKQFFQSEKKYVANDELSIADTNLFSALVHLQPESAKFDWSKHPNLAKYFKGLKGDPKFKNAGEALTGWNELTKA